MRHAAAATARIGLLALCTALVGACHSAPSDCGPPPVPPPGASSGGLITLRNRLASGGLRVLNRQVTTTGDAVRVSAGPGVGVIWIDKSEFGDGTIEADVCGRDIDQESFVGIAFHRRDDETYEAVYLRPFNFRSRSAERRQHAVQYVALPGSDYARLRTGSPGEFEKAVDPSAVTSGWNRLRILVRSGRVDVFVGNSNTAALTVRELQAERHGQVGLFVDNGSDGVFANLRIDRF